MDSCEITITDNAAKKIKDLFSSGTQKGKIMHISVDAGGCSGFKYNYNFVEKQNDSDLVLTKNGAKILIDDISSTLMKGAVIDYVETLGFESFEIKNPVSTSRCGCGNSFSV